MVLLEKARGVIRVVLIWMVCLWYVVSSICSISLLAVIDINTINLKKDSSLYRVSYIDEDSNIHLKNGSFVESENIKEYVKVSKGSGTWYVEDGDLLVVEIVYRDLYRILLPNVVSMVVLSYFVVRWFFSRLGNKSFRYFMMAVFMLSVFLVVSVSAMYVGRVLGL